MTERSEISKYLIENCMRLKHGQCTTRGCLTRGGWKRGIYDSEETPTCFYKEAYDILIAARGAVLETIFLYPADRGKPFERLANRTAPAHRQLRDALAKAEVTIDD